MAKDNFVRVSDRTHEWLKELKHEKRARSIGDALEEELENVFEEEEREDDDIDSIFGF